MQIDEYTDLTDETAIYPGAGTGNWDELSYLGLGLGEAGEIQGKIKKILRDGAVDPEAIAKEIGDLFYYLCRTCRAFGYNPSEVLQMNIDKLFDRKDRGVLQGSGDDR